MDVLKTMAPGNVDGWRVVILGEASAAISQLTATEQEAVRHGLTILEAYGVYDAPLGVVNKLDSPEQLYLLHITGSPRCQGGCTRGA